MKDYPKKYEDNYTSEQYLKWCRVRFVTVEGMSNAEYKKEFHELAYEFSKSTYEYFIKAKYMFSKLKHNGVSRGLSSKKSFAADISFGPFHRCIVGADQRLFTWNSLFYNISSYFLEHYPDLGITDINNAVYPYSFVTLDHLVFVNRMEERLELLKRADKKKLGIAEFYDYVINYVCCYNEEHGERYFLAEPLNHQIGSRWMPYISINKKWEKKS